MSRRPRMKGAAPPLPAQRREDGGGAGGRVAGPAGGRGLAVARPAAVDAVGVGVLVAELVRAARLEARGHRLAALYASDGEVDPRRPLDDHHFPLPAAVFDRRARLAVENGCSDLGAA